jgi:hypothetical protein
MAKDKIFLKCSAKQKTFDNGGSLLSVGVKADDLIAFAKQHANGRGYVNLVIQERREVGQYGDTHTVSLDTYEPKAKHDDAPPF